MATNDINTRVIEVDDFDDWSPTLSDSINLAYNILEWTEKRPILVKLNRKGLILLFTI